MSRRLGHDIPPNDVAEKQRITDLKLDAALIHQLKLELSEEHHVDPADIWFMGLRDIFEMNQGDYPTDADNSVLIFLAESPSGRPWVMPLVSDWRYRCLTINKPYLEFSSYGAMAFTMPWKVENGMCQRGGYDFADPLPLSQRKWANFLKTLDALGVWNWKGYYEPIDAVIMDGHMWGLEIHDGERHVKCSGSNGYPDEHGRPTSFNDPDYYKRFQRLERAVKRLITPA